MIVNKFKNLQNRKGLTLIEIIVTIAIFSIVLVAIMNLFLFNNKVYNVSEKLTRVQFDVRMASDFITTELRNKDAISTEDNMLTNSIDLAKLQVKYPSLKDIAFEIIRQDSRYLVLYSISGSDINQENVYRIDTSVLLNNITSATESSGIKTAIYYE